MKDSSKRLRIALTLMGGIFFLAAVYALQGALLSSIIDCFHLESSVQGLPSSAAFVGACISLVLSLFVIGRVSRITLLAGSSGLCAVGLALLSFAPTFATFLLVWVLIGIAIGFIDTLLSSTMATLYTGRTSTRMMCCMHTIYGLSSIITAPVYAMLIRKGIAWNRVYLFTAALGVLVCAAFALFTRGAKDVLPSAEPKFSVALFKTLLGKGVLPILILAEFTNGLFMGGMTTWITRYVSQTFDAALGDVTLSFLFFGVLASRLAMAFLPINAKKYLVWSGVAAFAAFLPAFLCSNGVLAIAAITLAGVFFGSMIPCMLDFGCATFTENTMLISTPMMIAYYIGQGLGSPLVGFLEGSVNLGFGLTVCAAMLVINSLFCYMAVKKQAMNKE